MPSKHWDTIAKQDLRPKWLQLGEWREYQLQYSLTLRILFGKADNVDNQQQLLPAQCLKGSILKATRCVNLEWPGAVRTKGRTYMYSLAISSAGEAAVLTKAIR